MKLYGGGRGTENLEPAREAGWRALEPRYGPFR